MGVEFTNAFITETDELVRRLRQWNERRVEQQVTEQVDQEKRTIDVRVVQEAESKANQMLNTNQQWVLLQQQRFHLRQQRVEQFKQSLLWFGSWMSYGTSGILFYLGSLVIYLGVGTAIGINLPDRIACDRGVKSACYVLRWDKSRVLLPEQVEGLLKEYLKTLQKHPPRK